MKFNYTKFILITLSVILTKYGVSATFYSQANNQLFSTLTNWNTNAGGGGSNPVAGDLTNGANSFVIQNGHTITLDQNINVAALTVGGGASGVLTIGNSTTARTITIAGNLSVLAGANLNVGAFNAVHTLTVSGNISNNGTFNLVNTAVTRVCNTTMNGASFPTITGTQTPIFNDLTISAGAAGADITRSITVSGNFLVTNSTPLTTAQNSTITGSFTVNTGSTFTASGGTITFNNATSQSIDVNNTAFAGIAFTGTGTKSIVGSITATGLLTVGTGVTINDAGAAHTLTGGITINNTGVLNFSGLVNFAGTLTTGYDFSAGNTTNMGTAAWNFTNNVTTALTGVTAGQFRFTGDLTVSAGTFTISNNTGIISSGTAFLLTGTSYLILNGLTKPTGGVTNFPTGFSTYTIGSATTVRYSMAGDQVITAGSSVTYANLQLYNNNKTVSGTPLIITGGLTLNAVNADLSGTDVTLGGSVSNTGTCTLTNNQTFTLDANNVNQTLGAGATYNFNNLVIAQTNTPTASRTKTIAGNISVDGNFTATNSGGSSVLLNIIDLQANTIQDASPSGTFTLGSNVLLSVSGATASEFQSSLNSFTTIAMDATYGNQSRVRFNNTANATTQLIPYANTTGVFSYGNIELNGAGGAGNTNTKTAAGPLDINGNISYVGGTVIFDDGNFNHTIAGDWLLWNTIYATPGTTSIITFDGTSPQLIGNNSATYQFRNVVIANTTSVVSLSFTTGYTLSILGNLTINNAATLDASNRNIAIAGNWVQLGTGVFTQTATTTFNSTTADQTINIATPSTSYFGNLTITKNTGGAPQTVTAQTDIIVNGTVTLTTNQAILDGSNVTIRVGGNWTYNASTTFTSTGGTLIFFGNAAQTITNAGASPVFNNIVCTGTGAKNFSNTAITVNGNMTITGATVNWGGGAVLTLNGNWINTGATGVFGPSTGTLLLNGGAQNLGAGPFNILTAGGTSGTTKTFTDNIVLNGALNINANITVDISASNYALSVGGNWTNNGLFTCRTGTVTLTGGNATIVSGTAAGYNTGQNFYNLVVNKSTSANSATFGGGSDLTVLNDFTISTGTVNLQTSADAYVGGNFLNNDIFTVNNIGCQINLLATSGTKTFDPGVSVSSSYRNIIINAGTATYQLANNLNVGNAGIITLTAGTFLLNGKTVSLTGAAAGTTVVSVGAGTFSVDAGASLKLSDQTVITINNASSVFKVVGTASNYAVVTTNGSSATGYTINQSAGSFHAKYYNFSNLRTTGITLSGTTTVDATNNFSNGIFTSPASTGLTQYLDVSGIALGTLSASNTVFNVGTAGSKNVKASAGTTGYIEFIDASGALQGAANENDDGVATTGKVRWTYNGFFWTDGGNDGNWFNTANWSSGALPTATDNVYIDHTIKTGAFSNPVTVNASGAVCNNLTVNAGAGTAITLTLTGSGVLTASGNVSFLATNVLNFTGAGTFNVKGAFSYTGAASAPLAGTVAFTGTAGTNLITPGNFTFYNLTVNGSGAIYSLGAAITTNNDVTVSNGTLDVSGANYGITCNGNWTVNGGGAFTAQAGTVTLSKSGTSTQTITNGTFYNLTLNNTTAATTAVKSMTSACTILGALTIGNGGAGISQLNAGAYDLYVAGNWTNNCAGGYVSTGTTGLNGVSGTQTIAGSQSSTFNTLVLSGAANKTFNISEQVNGDLQMSSTSGTVTLAAAAVISDGGASNTFTISGATTFIVLGAFPTVFETVSLSATSTVRYQANGAQNVYSVASPGYGNLQVYANTAGTATTKTALGDLFLQTGITIGSGATDINVTLNMNNNNMVLSGTTFIQQTSAPQISWGTGTMTQNGGSWNIDADITGFNNLVLGGTGTKAMLANLNLITGNVTVQSGATFSMSTFTMTCTAGSKAFNLQSGSTLNCALTASVAFPTGFATYALDPTSTVNLNGAANQTVQCNSVTYGNLNLVPSVASTNETLNTNLVCAGDFSMNNNAILVDGGFNMNFSGTNIDIRTYTPTLSTSTITLSGGAQNFYNGVNGGNFTVGNVVFGGTLNSAKSLGTRTSVANNVVYISGTVVINSLITVNCTRNLFYSGTAWTNNGTYNHSGGLYTFNGTALQTINPGAANTYYSIAVSNTNNPGVLITSNGLNITTTTTINANARFDMGGSAAPAASITHTFGGAVVNSGYWTTTNSHLVFNGNNYVIPVNDAVTPGTTFTARNVTIGTNTKSLAATTTWQTDNLTINATATFNPGASTNTLNVKGDWTCNGTFTHNSNTVNFNGNGSVNSNAVSITVNTSPFFVVNFAPTSAAVAYTLQSNTTSIQSDMSLGSLGTLNLNGKVLNLGRNAAAVKTYTINGVLNVDANAVLSFNNQGSATAGVSQCVMTVSGSSAKLNILGSSNSAIATLTAVTGGTQAAGYYTAITVTGGAEIQARYYSINYLADAGMVVTSSATINNTNNFSDGTWSNMNTSGTGAANRYYLDVEAPAPSNTIANVTFNYGATPVPANRFNVKRSTAGTTIEFVDIISGTLGSYLYESDDLSATTGRIKWPAIINANWIGGVSSNFNVGANWSSGVTPTSNTNCTIGAVTAPNVSPVIDATSGAAVCKTLTITNGRLDMNGNIPNVDLDIQSSISIGTTGAGILNVGNSDVIIQVGGAWTRGAVAGSSFIHGNGTVVFNATSGSFTIDPKTTGNYAFGNVTFNGATSSYNIVGGLTAAGNMIINDATINPAAGITINMGGDYTNNSGTFTANASNTSTVVLNKAGAQSIYNATFYNLTVSGSGVKTFSSNCSVFNNTIVNNGATLRAPTGIEVLTLCSSNAGTVTINSGGMFDDNGGSHVFNGATWTATTSSYTGSGTLTFNRNAGQTIAGGQFNNLSLTTSGNVTVSADVAISSGVDVYFSVVGSALILNNNYKITGSGSGTFILGAGQQLNVNGTNNCPSGFAAYAFDPTSTTNYTQAFNQTVGPITYGNLTLNTATTKTLGGDIVVLGALTINNSTLDVSTNNYDISVSGNFNNNGTGSLVTNGGNHAGELILNGTGTQNIYIGNTGSKNIYNLTINKTSGTIAYVQTSNITILNNLLVQSGTFSLNGLTGNVAGDITVVNSGGNIAQSGTFNLNATTGAHTIQLSGSNLNVVTINAPGITYTAQDNISIYGNFTLTAGNFDGNGKYVNLGNTGTRTIAITSGGTYNIGAGGTLALGAGAVVSVAGTISVVGTPGSVATVTKTTGGSSYTFDVTGTIKAQYYLFEYMAASGIVINSSGTINTTNNFSDGTFANGPANCKYITFGNTQTMTINNVAFSTTPTGSANNAVKSTAGVITFYNSTGIFSGASYESDDGSASTGAIRWTGPETLNWIGAVSTDWYTAGNWASSLGGNGVPDATKNAIIATNASNRHPIIDGSGGSARCKNLTINSTMILTVTTGAGASDLVVNGDVQINGEIRASSANDYIEVTGNWVKAASGTVNLTNGTVTFNGTGSKTINNGTGTFKNVTINNAGLNASLGANTTMNGDLTITAGSLDVSGSFYALNVKGNWINNGTFNARTGSTATVTLSSTAAALTLNPGTSSFNHLTINAGVSSVYTLTTNDLSVAGQTTITSGELNLNSLTFNAGDNAGTDPVSITGTLNVNQNANLKLGTGASVTVNSGGTIKILGTSGNIATVTKQASGSTYGFTVSSGATIHAQYYLFEYMNAAGITVNAGATINTTNNFSNGTFSNGFAGGKFLVLLNNFTSYTANGVAFNSGPSYSVSRVSGSGDITFNDPTGPLANYLYEQDDASPTTGLVRWVYTNPQLIWIGVTSTDWQDPTNWNTTGPPGPPDLTTDVTIAAGTPYQPILTANALASDFTMASGSTLAMGNYNMNFSGKFSNNGGTFTTSSTVTMSATTGTITIDPGGSSFYNLTIAGSANFRSANSIAVANDFTINSGKTFAIANSAHTLTIGNSWNSNGATFTNGGGTVIFNKNSGTCSLVTGTAGAGGVTFANLSVIQSSASPTLTKTQTLTGNMTVTGTFLVSSSKCTFSCGTGNTVNLTGTLTFGTGATLAGGSSTINVSGSWLNNIGNPFSYGTSTVVFNGTSAQTITRSTTTGETFYNVTVNNAAGIVCAKPVVVYGALTLTNGLVTTTATNILNMAAGSTATIGTATSYVVGPMTYSVAAAGSRTLNFPLGKSTSWRPAVLNVTHSSAGAALYTAEMFNNSAKALNYSINGSSISSVSPVRYWQIDRSGTANLTSATVTLYYKTTGVADWITDPSNLRIAKTIGAGTQWNDVGGTGSAISNGTITSNAFTTFSKFTFANASGGTNPLPVELLSFTGTPSKGQVDLEWITLSEMNNDYFTVEKSIDGITFEELTKVDGGGNTTNRREYHTVDTNPFTGVNYYRLKQTDYDGGFVYSSIITVNFGSDVALTLTAYPNPAIQNDIHVKVSGNPGEEVNVVMRDVLGKVYSSQTTILGSGCNKLVINRSESMPAGVYFIVATSGNKMFCQRIIVQ
jgi:hypothetical protein